MTITKCFKFKTKIFFLTVLAYFLGINQDSLAGTDKRSHKLISELKVEGQPVTGSNRFLNEPIWDMGEELGQIGYNFVFGYNPGQNQPLALTKDSPLATVMASGTDENYLALFGLTLKNIEQKLINVPLHQAAVLSGPSGELSALPSVLAVPPYIRSRVASNIPVTLGKWLRMQGIAKFQCFDDGTSLVEMKLNGLFPDVIYSFWGVYSFDSNGNGIGDRIGEVPLGGVPNISVADKNGFVKFSRTLNFCPDNETRLKYLTVVHHSDANINGAVPDQVLLGFPGGIFAQAAISFPINVVQIIKH